MGGFRSDSQVMPLMDVFTHTPHGNHTKIRTDRPFSLMCVLQEHSACGWAPHPIRCSLPVSTLKSTSWGGRRGYRCAPTASRRLVARLGRPTRRAGCPLGSSPCGHRSYLLYTCSHFFQVIFINKWLVLHARSTQNTETFCDKAPISPTS